MKKIFYISVLFLFATPASVFAAQERFVRVKADAEVMAPPDRVTITVGLQHKTDNLKEGAKVLQQNIAKALAYCRAQHIKDKNIIMLIRKLLKAGILESDNLYIGDDGTPQGSILSPVLANIYMYYVLVRWFDEIVRPNCHGFASIINYADDFICCFQRKQDAIVFYKKWLPERLARAKLELAKDKTRIISFGRFAKENCKGKKPQTFEFLGFVHYCSTNRNGKFRVKRKTSSKKFTKKLVEFNDWCSRNRTLDIDELMNTYKKKVIGHFNYYGITDNFHMIQKYKFRTMQILFKWLNRRSQRKSYTWEEFNKLLEQYQIPKPRICVKIYDD